MKISPLSRHVQGAGSRDKDLESILYSVCTVCTIQLRNGTEHEGNIIFRSSYLSLECHIGESKDVNSIARGGAVLVCMIVC